MRRALLLMPVLFAAVAVAAGEYEVTAIEHPGVITWSNIAATGRYHVEWASSPTGAWKRHWVDLRDIVSTQDFVSAAVPMFYRVIHQPRTEIEWITVGNAGNPVDTTGYGAISYDFKIGKYEISNDQYADFLNTVDVEGRNQRNLYAPSAHADSRSGISWNTNFPPGKRFVVKPNMGDRPVNFVNFWSAARFCNWLHHGKGTNTESGAYNFVGGATNPANNAISRNPSARYFIPNESEWYKASYYSGSSSNYTAYPTRQNAAPDTAQTDSLTGEITNSSQSNIANYNNGAAWGGLIGHVTRIGNTGAGSASHYGASDMGGNVSEWIESLIGTSERVVRGGSWLSFPSALHKDTRVGYLPLIAIDSHGFRVAAPAD